jgi:hypothetical protein
VQAGPVVAQIDFPAAFGCQDVLDGASNGHRKSFRGAQVIWIGTSARNRRNFVERKLTGCGILDVGKIENPRCLSPRCAWQRFCSFSNALGKSEKPFPKQPLGNFWLASFSRSVGTVSWIQLNFMEWARWPGPLSRFQVFVPGGPAVTRIAFEVSPRQRRPTS